MVFFVLPLNEITFPAYYDFIIIIHFAKYNDELETQRRYLKPGKGIRNWKMCTDL